ncbi:MAG: ATP-binding protein [Nannocystaceae bacterium]|nr:two-component sensor histidine kinase [Myxococcales bacterium]
MRPPASHSNLRLTREDASESIFDMRQAGARSRGGFRMALLTIAMLLGIGLIAAAASNYAVAKELSRTVDAGQGEALLHSFMQRLGPPPPDPEKIEEAAASLRELGLRSVHFVRADRSVAFRSHHAPPLPPSLDVRSASPQRIGASTWILQPPGPGEHKGPPPEKAGRFAGAEGKGPPEPGMHPRPLIEFTPLLSEQLISRARRDLALALATSVTMMLIAVVIVRLSIRADRAEARLDRQRHLAALGEMSAVLAHEIRNPLTSLKGHAQLLAEALPDDGRPRQKAERIVHEAVRLQDLTTALLDFARSGEIRREPTDVVALIEDAASSAGTPCALTAEGAPERWPLDPLRIHQVLLNLLKNARQADPDGTPAVTVREHAGALHITVRDHGDGIDPAMIERIFEPFQTSRVQGTGLGLSVARRVVELHGGTITAGDAPGGGAEFHLTIPRDAPSS